MAHPARCTPPAPSTRDADATHTTPVGHGAWNGKGKRQQQSLGCRDAFPCSACAALRCRPGAGQGRTTGLDLGDRHVFRFEPPRGLALLGAQVGRLAWSRRTWIRQNPERSSSGTGVTWFSCSHHWLLECWWQGGMEQALQTISMRGSFSCSCS